jgi:MPBQ/MSBQ methyltransferase
MPAETTKNQAADALVVDHYAAPDLGQRILGGVSQEGKVIDALNADDLAAVDEFHIRGREATVELAGMVGMRREAAVLDIGCGIGGTARHLAAEYGCHVSGIDLTPDYCTLARDLSARVGLEGRTSFRQGSALDLPWKDESFDIVWTEHVQMNISDKERFYREAARMLRKGGRFAFHDIFAGANDGLTFPVPWAGAPDMSFLAPANDVRDLLKNLELTEVSWEDSTARSTAWFEAARERNAKLGPPALGLHLVMGPTAQQKFGNVLSGLKNGQLTTVLAVFEK